MQIKTSTNALVDIPHLVGGEAQSSIPRVNTMQTENLTPLATRYVTAPRLLKILFDEASCPSLRWLRDRQKDRSIPFVRCGRKIFFDPELVKLHFNTKATAHSHVKGSVQS
jgi:hypothetical protein